jgi:hypothetical protein
MMPLIPVSLVLALAAFLFLRFTVLSGNRVRSIRWRIRLRVHPAPGFASFPELVPACFNGRR